MVIKVVIGANFGDEGKGLMTDYFCHQSALRGEKCLVVLHNGGAQRGHTVVTPDGKRHVFHHFGSGTFTEADNYLSGDFILNPMVFRQEYEELEALGISPKVYANPFCRVTTPYEMIANQMLEESRHGDKHGSCGLGIYETIVRDHKLAVPFSVADIDILCSNQPLMIYKIINGIKNYIVLRLKKENVKITDEWAEIIESDGLVENYFNDLRFMLDKITIEYSDCFYEYDCVVFEGGQGLLLDQNNLEYYPHLTPSNTGIKNPLHLINVGLPNDVQKEIEICYVTRTYLTRHGAGRFHGECDKAEINPNMQDLTNVPNPHQGTLRYAKLDEGSLEDRILKDFEAAKKYGAKLSLAVTHENEYNHFFSNSFQEQFENIYHANGETRESVTETKGND